MKDIWKLVLSLGLICLFGSAALVYVNGLVAEPKRLADEKALNASLRLVLPPETAKIEAIAPKQGQKATFYRSLDAAGKTIAFAGKADGQGGFKGPVTVVAGLKPDGTFIAVMVTNHSETPGVGTKATDRKLQKSFWDVIRGKAKDEAFPPNDFLDKFAGKPVAAFMKGQKSPVKNCTGATYSSRAVQNGIATISEAFAELEK